MGSGRPRHGGGWHAIRYSLQLAYRLGPGRLWRAMRSRNACKTCALGMGGQQGGMTNESGHFPEVCKKSLQAMAFDMQAGIAKEFFANSDIAALKAMSPRQLEAKGRLTEPLYLAKGATHYRPISWHLALRMIADKLKKTAPQQAFFYASGRSSNEAGFLFQLFARALGSNHISNCSYYCHQASGVALQQALGVGTATVSVDDVEQADLLLLVGANPASNHPRFLSQLVRLRRRGGRVIVINPVREVALERFRVPSDVRSLLFGSKIADEYIQPHVGGDQALLMGVAKALCELHQQRGGVLAEQFMATHCHGQSEVMAVLKDTDRASLERESGVPWSTMLHVAELYARSQQTIIAWTMGITHHPNGVQNVQWLINLSLMRGMIGRAGAGLLPLRGHSNVQGMGTIGVTPALKAKAVARFEHLGLPLPAAPGLDTLATLEAAAEGRFRFGMALGGNLYGASPDAAYTHQAIGAVELMVYCNTSLNTGHAHGLGQETLILPVLARDEEPYRTTQESMFSFVRLSDGGAQRHLGPRPELHVLAELADLVLQRTPLRPKDQAGVTASSQELVWRELRDADRVRALIAKLVPDLEGIAEIAEKGEFAIPGRRLTATSMPAENGQARLLAAPLWLPAEVYGRGSAAWPLTLMTARSEGQFNTVVYEDHDYYRGQDRRDIILLNPDDIHRFGLKDDDEVEVRSPAGVMAKIKVRSFAIKAGNAMMYFPEANVLVPRWVDPVAKTPVFKRVPMRLERHGQPLVMAPSTSKGQHLAAASGGGTMAMLAWLRHAWRRHQRPVLPQC